MNIERNQHWLNYYNCHVLSFIKERKLVAIQEIKNLGRIYRETSTSEILMTNISPGFDNRESPYV